MTVEDLLREAQRIDPSVSYEIVDSTIYATGRSPQRSTRVVQAHSSKHGEGSHENIDITLRSGHVVAITPGSTTQFWQADPLLRAWREADLSSAKDVPR